VEYWLPPDDYGYSDRVGMLGLVVLVNPEDRVMCQVLWARFSHHGPQWYKIKHLRPVQCAP